MTRPKYRNRITHKALRDMRRLGHEAFGIDKTHETIPIFTRAAPPDLDIYFEMHFFYRVGIPLSSLLPRLSRPTFYLYSAAVIQVMCSADFSLLEGPNRILVGVVTSRIWFAVKIRAHSVYPLWDLMTNPITNYHSFSVMVFSFSPRSFGKYRLQNNSCPLPLY